MKAGPTKQSFRPSHAEAVRTSHVVTAGQLIAHAVGDYIFQSEWMATNKTKHSWPAAIHATTYTFSFLPFRPSPAAMSVIAGSHFVIDRWRLARHVVFAKNHLAPRREWSTWLESSTTGYPPSTPPWMATWLMVIVDNTLHILINGLALRFFPR